MLFWKSENLTGRTTRITFEQVVADVVVASSRNHWSSLSGKALAAGIRDTTNRRLVT